MSKKKVKVLVVVDMQNDFITGSLANPDAVEIIPNVVKVVNEFLNDDAVVFFTQDTHFDNYLETEEGKHLPVEHCISDTKGWALADDLNEIVLNNTDNPNIYCVRKQGFGCIHLVAMLSSYNLESITLVGVCTDICVVSTALVLKSYYHNIPMKVIGNCCAGVSKESHQKALDIMKQCHIDIEEI